MMERRRFSRRRAVGIASLFGGLASLLGSGQSRAGQPTATSSATEGLIEKVDRLEKELAQMRQELLKVKSSAGKSEEKLSDWDKKGVLFYGSEVRLISPNGMFIAGISGARQAMGTPIDLGQEPSNDNWFKLGRTLH